VQHQRIHCDHYQSPAVDSLETNRLLLLPSALVVLVHFTGVDPSHRRRTRVPECFDLPRPLDGVLAHWHRWRPRVDLPCQRSSNANSWNRSLRRASLSDHSARLRMFGLFEQAKAHRTERNVRFKQDDLRQTGRKSLRGCLERTNRSGQGTFAHHSNIDSDTAEHLPIRSGQTNERRADSVRLLLANLLLPVLSCTADKSYRSLTDENMKPPLMCRRQANAGRTMISIIIIIIIIKRNKRARTHTQREKERVSCSDMTIDSYVCTQEKLSIFCFGFSLFSTVHLSSKTEMKRKRMSRS
jgi:hypothetical protein